MFLNHFVHRLLQILVFPNMWIFSALISLFPYQCFSLLYKSKKFKRNWQNLSLHPLLICPAWSEMLVFTFVMGKDMEVLLCPARGSWPHVHVFVVITSNRNVCWSSGIYGSRSVKPNLMWNAVITILDKLIASSKAGGR